MWKFGSGAANDFEIPNKVNKTAKVIDLFFNKKKKKKY